MLRPSRTYGQARIAFLEPSEMSAVDVSGGSTFILGACQTSIVNISGGGVNILDAYDSSAVTFHGWDFSLGAGLSLVGERLLGTSVLSGEWFDGTPWAANIRTNASGATVLAISDPTTLSLLLLGGLVLARRKRRP